MVGHGNVKPIPFVKWSATEAWLDPDPRHDPAPSREIVAGMTSGEGADVRHAPVLRLVSVLFKSRMLLRTPVGLEYA